MYSNEDLDHEIISAVKAQWIKDHCPLLISFLGLSHLSADAKKQLREEGVGLKRFVKNRLSDRVRFIPMIRHGGGFAPVEETNDITNAELEQAYSRVQAKKAVVPHSSFDKALWAAFSDPMPPLNRRLAGFRDGRWHVRLASKDEPLAPDEVAIEPEDLPSVMPDSSSTAGAATRRALLEWSRKHRIDRVTINSTVAPRPVEAPKPNVLSHSLASGEGADALVKLLQSLPKDQLARLMVPGDLIASILERMGLR